MFYGGAFHEARAPLLLNIPVEHQTEGILTHYARSLLDGLSLTALPHIRYVGDKTKEVLGGRERI